MLHRPLPLALYLLSALLGSSPTSGARPCQAAPHPLRLAAVLSDRMVVQRDAVARIWGWAEPQASVTVEASWSAGAVVSSVADERGRFQAEIETPGAGGPHTITVRSDAAELRIEDVLSGELWLCSGQSNMEWHMSSTPEGVAAIPAADHPQLRLFTVPRDFDAAPLDDLAGGAWEPCTPDSVEAFSAVGYFFGSELQEHLDGVPIGLINSTWGGTVIEAWMRAPALREQGDFDAVLDRLRRVRAGAESDDIEQRQKAWWKRLETTDPGFLEARFDAEHDSSAWSKVRVPMRFTDVERGDWDGTLWFRRAFETPAAFVDRALTLELGAVDDMDVTWINGVEVGAVRGAGRWSEDRAYSVPAGLVQAGSNSITVLAVDTGGAGTLGGTGDPQVGIRLRAESGEALELDGAWSYRSGVSMTAAGAFPSQGWLHQNTPSTLHNAMIAPLAPLHLAGVIWYQGESNISRAQQYRRLMPGWIADWRATFAQPELPMLWVQIAPWARPEDRGHVAELREAQALATRLPGTGMAITMDIGDPNDIHPAHKDVVGQRLALLARRQVYGQDVACFGPTFRAASREGGALRLTFDHAHGLRADAAAAAAFQVAGRDRVFHPAQIEIEGASLRVRSANVPKPVAARFAWVAGAVVALANDAGLPAASFRTDDWPMVSADR